MGLSTHPKTKMAISTHPNRRSCAKAEPGYSGKLVVGHVGGNHELARQGGCHLAVGSGESIFNFVLFVANLELVLIAHLPGLVCPRYSDTFGL